MDDAGADVGVEDAGDVDDVVVEVPRASRRAASGAGAVVSFDDPAAGAITERLSEVGGDTLVGVLLFGSRLVGTEPDRFSAFDLVVVVDAYGPFYRRLRDAGHHRRPAWLLSAVARLLAPNVVAFDPGLEGGELAKCMIVTIDDFERALGPRARDHFLVGRMVQTVALLRARDEDAQTRLQAAVASARLGALGWVAPWLESPFSTEAFARRMLEVSYAGEIRPEAAGRAADVFEAQRDVLLALYEEVLGLLAEAGRVERAGDGWSLVESLSAWRRLRARAYFARSKARATARWFKHTITFNDWLTYVQRKVERRTGMVVPLTPLERRLPYLLLWPKVFRVLRNRPRS